MLMLTRMSVTCRKKVVIGWNKAVAFERKMVGELLRHFSVGSTRLHVDKTYQQTLMGTFVCMQSK
jgi:hypothetical protein